jgi:hypothetical protein
MRRFVPRLPEDFSPLYAGVTCLLLGNGWLRARRIGARLWNKKVNLLVVCFAGYECFQPRLFMARALCGSLKGEEMHLGGDYLLFSLTLYSCLLLWFAVFVLDLTVWSQLSFTCQN